MIFFSLNIFDKLTINLFAACVMQCHLCAVLSALQCTFTYNYCCLIITHALAFGRSKLFYQIFSTNENIELKSKFSIELLLYSRQHDLHYEDYEASTSTEILVL